MNHYYGNEREPRTRIEKFAFKFRHDEDLKVRQLARQVLIDTGVTFEPWDFKTRLSFRRNSIARNVRFIREHVELRKAKHRRIKQAFDALLLNEVDLSIFDPETITEGRTRPSRHLNYHD